MFRTMSGTLLLALAAATFAPASADACGGFFCNNQPIDQSGEKILFVMDEGHVTAHIQIQYQGTSEQFSWVVPTTVVPEVSVGTDEIFPILSGETQPYVSREYSERNCEDRGGYFGAQDGASDAGAGPDGDIDGDADYDGVDIVDSGIVGPFEWVTLDSEDTEALLDWLRENDYVIPEAAYPIVDSYVSADSYFVGLKLTKDSETGDLQPIVLSMDTDEACVPLRLTAIAATDNMPVYVWFVGRGRAVSTNWPDLVLDDVQLHHPAARGGRYGYYGGYYGNDPYADLVSNAIDAAGGRAFVTDFAGASWPLLRAIDSGRYETSRIAGLTDAQRVMDELSRQGFSASQLLMGILAEFMPVPDGVEARDFYNCPSCYVDETYTFDPVGLAQALEDRIAGPLREIESDVARQTHLTRLYTTISPSEMTEDPFFGINRDLPLVDRPREATVIRDCRGTRSDADDFEEITTENGHHFCAALDGTDAPPAPLVERLVQYDVSGAGEVVEDNTREIDAAAYCGAGGLPPPVGGDAGGGGGLCVAVPGLPVGAGTLALLAGAACVLVLRRRK